VILSPFTIDSLCTTSMNEIKKRSSSLQGLSNSGRALSSSSKPKPWENLVRSDFPTAYVHGLL